MRTIRRLRRQTPRFCPCVDLAGEGAVVLDRRLLLSAAAARGGHAAHPAGRARPAAHLAVHVNQAAHAPRRVTPAQEINKVYARFLANLQAVEVLYVQTLSQQSSNTLPVS